MPPINLLWNSKFSDSRGRELEECTFRHGLNVVNRPCGELDFTPGGTAFVDVTLAGDQTFIPRWLFLAMPSMSDHPYVFFKIRISGLPIRP